MVANLGHARQKFQLCNFARKDCIPTFLQYETP